MCGILLPVILREVANLLIGCMRMRKLGHGQSVMFFAPLEVDRQIRTAGRLSESNPIQAVDIIRWAMLETCADLEHHVPHWAEQGISFDRRATAYSTYVTTADLNVLKQGWVTRESRTLEELYGLSTGSGSSPAMSAFDIPHLRERLDSLGIKLLRDASLDEEQEREVNHEVEIERQVERPPKMDAAIHELHDDVKQFIWRGYISGKSKRFPALFAPLGNSAWIQDTVLRTSVDYATTIAGITPSRMSDYLRPVHWVVSGGIGDKFQLVVLSPFEVNNMLPTIRKSTIVHLHLYTPRVTQAMRSLSDLMYYCVPPLPDGWASPKVSHQSLLNLWAGQLYLDNHHMYMQLFSVFRALTGGRATRRYVSSS